MTVASWIIGKTLGRIYPQILVRNAQIDVIRKARESGYPIVYLPVHRSHVDYVLVSWVLVACDLRAPLVAAGDNLNIPIFSLMMRSVGGFFIKRGLLSIVVDNLLAKKVEDVLVVPVNFSYERLLDGNFIREQLGRPKVSESFASAALGLWNSLQAKFGSARIDFGQPFSLREFVNAYQYDKVTPQLPLPLQNGYVAKAKAKLVQSLSNPSAAPSPNMDIDSVEQREMVNSLAKHVIYDGEKCFSMMSTNAISFILLNKYRKGVTTQVLAKEIELLAEEMLDRGYDVGISGNMEDVITHGFNSQLTVLGPTLVRQDRTATANGQSALIRPVTKLPNIIELAYYSNCVLPAYALEAVIATSVSVLSGAKRTEAESISIDENVLISTVLEFCEILQNEFIFAPPCTNLEDAVRSTVQYMTKQKVFFRTLLVAATFKRIPPTIILLQEHDKDMVHVDTKNQLERITFLTNLLKPIVDTYFTAACVLRCIVGFEIQEKQLQMDILTEIKSLLQHDSLTYGESLAMDPVRNFIKLMSGWEVLESYKYDRTTVYYLQDHFDCDKTIEEVIRRIQKYRDCE
ncbi:Glycerol-3-phosphate acyltransferase 1, mitochondrial [Orchesella cincta]|uniref:Glycerol-3-phosphate acyltransferase 1, mitochondrial n=1 Tax=Orchesella cincta TaxID=48709 RepID=A0A1D2NLR6_ORCCI|nr:Glycerol-3-phosphate acyltransferase 1, mitochondrial [Orchesella cincta]